MNEVNRALASLDEEEALERRNEEMEEEEAQRRRDEGEGDEDGDQLDEPDGVADITRVASNRYTRRRLTKRLTGRKYGVLRDDYDLYGKGGCYCFMPYDKVDDKNKCLFKIGMSLDFTKRIDDYRSNAGVRSSLHLLPL
jgi:hypothetical protein